MTRDRTRERSNERESEAKEGKARQKMRKAEQRKRRKEVVSTLKKLEKSRVLSRCFWLAVPKITARHLVSQTQSPSVILTHKWFSKSH